MTAERITRNEVAARNRVVSTSPLRWSGGAPTDATSGTTRRPPHGRTPGARLAPPSAVDGQPPKLLGRVRRAIRSRHYSRRTEAAYVHWIRQFIVYHGKRHPVGMGAVEISACLAWLALERRVSASTQNQALSGVLFLCGNVLHVDLGKIEHVPRAAAPERVPIVLSRDEVGSVLAQLSGVPLLVASLLYGAGLRRQECLNLRVKDLDCEGRQVVVRRGKGQKNRRTTMPLRVVEPLTLHLQHVRRLHDADHAAGYGRVVLPDALTRKYPNASADWLWQFAFPAARICRDPWRGAPPRFHLHESVI